MLPTRTEQLQRWLIQTFASEDVELSIMSGDAGFRRYFRFRVDDCSYIAVDAPPEKSNNQAFVDMQQVLNEQGVIVPQIIAVDLSLGFFCLSDFGDCLFSDRLNDANMLTSYQQAIDLLPNICQLTAKQARTLARYDREFILREVNIFSEWLLAEHLAISLTISEQQQLDDCFELLIDNMLAQPQVLVHRDYHSRNIMVLENDQLGIIDFQDAVIGPITYDIVSLLRDCYLKWPAAQVDQLFTYFCVLITEQFKLSDISRQHWQQWFDLTGLQRHIKASGIFARLHHRDGKSGYLKDIPLTLTYIVDISAQYPQLHFLHQLVNERVLPTMAAKASKMTEQDGQFS